jgi:hypothetical protein
VSDSTSAPTCLVISARNGSFEVSRCWNLLDRTPPETLRLRSGSVQVSPLHLSQSSNYHMQISCKHSPSTFNDGQSGKGIWNEDGQCNWSHHIGLAYYSTSERVHMIGHLKRRTLISLLSFLMLSRRKRTNGLILASYERATQQWRGRCIIDAEKKTRLRHILSWGTLTSRLSFMQPIRANTKH